MKHWKKQGKRGLSLFLSVVMCLSMVNLTAFAEETSGKIVSQKEDWTMTDDGSVGHKKTIRKTGENTFEITLSVKTKEEIAQQVTSPDAAVVVVMDVSNSMAWTVDGKEAKDEAQQRITKAKAAAEKFIEDFAADAGNAQRKVALVEFGSNAMTVQGWTDATTAKNAVSKIGINFGTPACTIQGQHTHEENTIEWGGIFHNRWRCSVETCEYYVKNPGVLWLNCYHAWSNGNYEGHTHEKTYNGPHGDVTKDGGGTNIEGGLQLADNLLATCNVPNKYVVLITDGVPTYHVYQSHYIPGNTNFIEGQKGGGNEAKPSDYVNVPTVASSIKSKGTLYTVSYASSTVRETVNGKPIDTWLSSFATMNVQAGNNINWGLDSVSETIKNQAKAWILTDPIPAPYIVYNPEDNSNIPNADENPDSVLNYKTDGTGTNLTWDLKRVPVKGTEQDGSAKWYLYETTYTVRLDTAAKDFVENQAYPTNRTTTLTYMLTKDGVLQSDLKSTNLVVPEVSGTLPMVEWRIEYYKQENATAGDYKNYTLADTTNGGPDKLWTKVELKTEDQDWESKYAHENYEHASSNQSIVVGMDKEANVIKVYYNRKTTDVTVNHYYGKITVNGDGQKVEPVWDTITPIPMEEHGKFVGESYVATEHPTLGNQTYTLDHADPSSKTITLKEDARENVINLYYVWDDRGDTSVTVNHVYRTHTWVVEDNKWVPKTETSEPRPVDKVEGLKVGDSYTTTYTTAEGFQADSSNNPTIDKLAANGNVITLYFDKYEETEPQEAFVVVNHHYLTRTVTVDDNGEIQTKVEVEDVNGTAEAGHVGDVVDITEAPREGFVADSANLKSVTLKSGLNTVNLWYSKVNEPASASIKVTHTYYTIQHVIETEYEEVPVFDPETGEPTGETVKEVVGTKEYDVKTEDTDLYADETISGLYENQLYTAGAKYKGYTPCDTNVYSGRATVDGSNTIELKYYKNLDENDKREEARIGVTHKYITHLTTLVEQPDGTTAVGTTDVIAYGSRDEYAGKKGETYVAKPEPNLGSHTYTKISPDDSALTVVLTGDNDDIEIVYEREATQLPELITGYTVDYVYNTYVMTVDPDTGVAGYGEPTVERGEQVTSEGSTLYVGQIVKLDAGAKDGFEAAINNPATLQILQAEGNNFTFEWNKYEPLPKVKVTVNHHYETITIDRDGTQHSSTDDVSGWPVAKYTGESYEANAREYWGGQFTLNKAAVNGEDVTAEKTITVKADEDVVIDFYYSRTEDHSCPVEYSIQYYYYDVDYDGTETLTGEPPATTGSSFAGKPLATTPEEEDVKGYRLTEATFNGDNIMGQQSVTLVDGENKVVYVYKRNVDTRPKTTHVTVYHQYYFSDSAENFAYEDMVVTRDLPIGSSFTAEEITTKNGDTYLRTTPDSELTKELIADSGSNIIHIRYVLAKTTYKVVHTYYTNGSLTGSTDPVTVGGNVGDVVTADSVAKVLTYGGNSYSYTSSSGEFTLVQGENGTITLRYDRTTGGGGDNGGGNNNNNDDDDDDNGSGTPTPPVVDVPDEQPPLIEEPVIDIPDEQPPKEEAPEEEILEEEILEEEVPLSDVPQTGDNSKPVFWAVLGALSFLGIVLLGRKRKDEEA